MRGFLIGAAIALLGAGSANGQQVAKADDCGCWIDAKTGKPVPTAPLSGANFSTPTGPANLGSGTAAVIDPLEPNRASNSKTGQTFIKTGDCSWIDAKTGKPVPTAPLSGANFSTPTGPANLGSGTAAVIDPLEPNRASNSKTGQTFIRVPCPPPPKIPPPANAGGCKTAALLALSPLGQSVIEQLNFARTQPAAYAQSLTTYRTYLHGTLVKEPGAPLINTNEGTAAVDDAIAFLSRQAPLPPLIANPFLTDAATRFANQAGSAGLMGHAGPDGVGLADRLKANCFIAGYVGEIIAYRQAVAVAVVRQLIIDDGLRSRLHRSDVFSPVAKVVGVGCGPHATQGSLCVVDLAGAMVAQPEPPMETDAELAARRTKEDAASDQRFAATTGARRAYHVTLDKIAGTSVAPKGVCETVKDSVSLDANGIPTDATIDFYCKDFDLPLYQIRVDAAGVVEGQSITAGYRAYMTMKAAVGGGRIAGEFSYGNGPEGRFVEHVAVRDADGVKRGVFTFNPDGTAKSGEVFNAEGQRTGVINGP